ncbi:MAG: hypothetical protein IT378_23410, partial [Sandaracinaceae bacterium]|nr:hypothetical protein [Sandaracinaceae bacterium]
DVDVDGEGVVTYVFRELAAHPKVRVEAEDQAEAEAETDAGASSERAREER